MAQKTSWDGAPITESDINTYLMGEGGAWTSWTPTITQGVAVTATVSSARFARYGRTIVFRAHLAVTGAGTSTTDIVLSLPVAAASGIVFNMPIGLGQVIDSSASQTHWGMLVHGTDASTVRIKSSSTTSNTYLGGSVLTAALASGDSVWYEGKYEAAS